MKRKHAGERMAGFSLIELLAAATILGVLASVAVPVVETTVRRQKEHELRIALRDIRHALDSYKLAADKGHIKVNTGDSGYPASLINLVAGVKDEKSSTEAKLYFLRRVPRDPFFSDRSVTAVDTWGQRSYASPPDAPEPGADVFDVYSRSALKGLNGVAYSEW